MGIPAAPETRACSGKKPLPRAKHNQSDNLSSGSHPTNHQTVLNSLERTNQRWDNCERSSLACHLSHLQNYINTCKQRNKSVSKWYTLSLKLELSLLLNLILQLFSKRNAIVRKFWINLAPLFFSFVDGFLAQLFQLQTWFMINIVVF